MSRASWQAPDSKMRGTSTLNFQLASPPLNTNMKAPASVEQFQQVFPNWPEDSISQRSDQIGSGSSWGIREIGTFQVIRRPPTNEVPLFLNDYWAESNNRVTKNVDLQALFGLLAHKNWRAMNHEQIQKAVGPLAGFLSALSQVMEEPIIPEADRLMRARVQTQVTDQAPIETAAPSSSSNSQEALPPFGSSPTEQEYPNKRFRPDRSSGSYVPSDPESDQSVYDQRAKPEFATNSCINELLR
jgi:hypothetical protein